MQTTFATRKVESFQGGYCQGRKFPPGGRGVFQDNCVGGNSSSEEIICEPLKALAWGKSGSGEHFAMTKVILQIVSPNNHVIFCHFISLGQ